MIYRKNVFLFLIASIQRDLETQQRNQQQLQMQQLLLAHQRQAQVQHQQRQQLKAQQTANYCRKRAKSGDCESWNLTH